MKLKNSTVVITGGKRIGRVVALALAEKGANIVLTYRTSKTDIEKTAKLIQKKKVKTLVVKTDVSKNEDVKNLVKLTLQKFKKIDILINMASIFPRIPFKQIKEKDFDMNIDANLKGAFLCSKHFGEVMLRQKHGKIINLADAAVERPYLNYMPYLVAKGGVVTLTKVLAKELAPYIQVNCISPGPILLPEGMSKARIKKIINSVLLKRLGSPDDIAATVLYLIEGTDFVTGIVIPVDGGKYST